MVVPNGIKSIPNLIQIRSAVLELNHADRRTDTDGHLSSFLHIVQRRHNNDNKSTLHQLKLAAVPASCYVCGQDGPNSKRGAVSESVRIT
jgi:hypothetical protein